MFFEVRLKIVKTMKCNKSKVLKLRSRIKENYFDDILLPNYFSDDILKLEIENKFKEAFSSEYIFIVSFFGAETQNWQIDN